MALSHHCCKLVIVNSSILQKNNRIYIMQIEILFNFVSPKRRSKLVTISVLDQHRGMLGVYGEKANAKILIIIYCKMEIKR